VHHHGESETAIYVLRGTTRWWVGDRLDDVREARAGDFVFIPRGSCTGRRTRATPSRSRWSSPAAPRRRSSSRSRGTRTPPRTRAERTRREGEAVPGVPVGRRGQTAAVTVDGGSWAAAWRGVGWASLALAGVAVAAPRRLAAAAGVRHADEDATLPLLVRLAAARQVALGLALLTRRPLDPRRAAGLFLPLTAVDAAAVLAAWQRGTVAPRAAVASLAVLAATTAAAGAPAGGD